MKKALSWAPLIIGWIILTSSAQASTITYSLDTSFPGKPNPDGAGPWLTAAFDDEGSVNSVYLTLTANLTGDNFAGTWYCNLDPDLDPTELLFAVQGSDPHGTLIETGTNAFKADGDGWFDIRFTFLNEPANRFDDSDSITYLITYTGTGDMAASSFDFRSESGGAEGIWYTAAHIQGISMDAPGSTWIGFSAPIPGAVWLLGSGLVCLVAFRRRFNE